MSIMKRPVADVVIRYNLSVNELYGGYHYGFENDTDLSNVHVYNNTHYYGKGQPVIMGPNLHRTPIETVFNNNIFHAVNPGSMGVNAENGTNVVYDTNVYYNITPPVSEVNARTEDPLFVGAGQEPHDIDMKNGRDVLSGYRLSTHSPYLEGGKAIEDNGGKDFWGDPVPEGATSFGASAHSGFKMNAGLNDAWYNPATDGQGFLITVFPAIHKTFLAWFTFDSERPADDVIALLGEPGHRWFTALGPHQGDSAELELFVTRDGIFDSPEPVTRTELAGGLTLEFADCLQGIVSYDIPSMALSGSIPIQRVAEDNVGLCEQLNRP